MTALDAPSLTAFADRARTFLAEHAPARADAGARTWGEGPDDLGAGAAEDRASPEARARAQAWRALLFDHGYGWLSGPTAYGGADLTPQHEEVFADVLAEFETPDQSLFQVSRGMVGPAILEHGTDELRARFLPGIHRGDIICCQLLSEPAAGSDLAGLRTRAVRDGDEWVVNGQKVWSSFAHVAAIGQLLARTDPDAPKHQGLSMFLLPMDAPGVTVRPLRQMTGQAHFNEVFFDDVRVPDANRVGPPGGGWRAILTTLMNERHVVANRSTSSTVDLATQLFALARHLGVTGDPIVRQQLADVHIHDAVLRFLRLRMEAAAEAGHEPGPEGSIAKLLYSTQLRRIGAVAGHVLGPAMVADSGAWGTYAWAAQLCSSPGLRIAGGTDEIQRNTLGERALGLPKEPPVA